MLLYRSLESSRAGIGRSRAELVDDLALSYTKGPLDRAEFVLHVITACDRLEAEIYF